MGLEEKRPVGLGMERPMTWNTSEVEMYLMHHRAGVRNAHVIRIPFIEEGLVEVVATFVMEPELRVQQTKISIPNSVLESLDYKQTAHLIYVNRRPL